MKKGDMSLQYVFLIFIGVIAVFVIVGMLTKWSYSSNKFMCTLTGECNKANGVVDKKTIISVGPQKFINDIVKHSKLCYETVRSDPDHAGELCYTVKCCTDTTCTGTCTASCGANIIDPVVASLGVDTIECDDFLNSDKAIISYSQGKYKVVIS